MLNLNGFFPNNEDVRRLLFRRDCSVCEEGIVVEALVADECVGGFELRWIKGYVDVEQEDKNAEMGVDLVKISCVVVNCVAVCDILVLVHNYADEIQV